MKKDGVREERGGGTGGVERNGDGVDAGLEGRALIVQTRRAVGGIRATP
ncbi:MAG: hypothetical protein ACTS27_11980 [Phycisphaerales bacterium]